jgi:predicted phage baseplate assembly protein
VDDLVYCGPGDPHFSVDREMSELRFGDGYHGRLPVGECTRARLRYHVGGGRSGNLAAGRDWQADRRNVFAVNVVPAEGGADPETLADAAKRAAHEWQQPTRTVTAADFEHLACHVPGAAIGRARAAIGHHPQYPCTSVEGAVTVFVVPDVPQPTREEWLASPLTWSALAPDRPTLELVRAELDKRRLVTQEVFVSAPIYEDIFVTVWIGGVPVNADRVREDVTLAMFRRFHSLWGGDDGTGWPFGEDVFPSAVMKHAQQALDDGLIVTRVSIAGRCGQATQCEPFPIGPLGLPSLKRIQLRFAPTPQTEGGLG